MEPNEQSPRVVPRSDEGGQPEAAAIEDHSESDSDGAGSDEGEPPPDLDLERDERGAAAPSPLPPPGSAPAMPVSDMHDNYGAGTMSATMQRNFDSNRNMHEIEEESDDYSYEDTAEKQNTNQVMATNRVQ